MSALIAVVLKGSILMTAAAAAIALMFRASAATQALRVDAHDRRSAPAAGLRRDRFRVGGRRADRAD